MLHPEWLVRTCFGLGVVTAIGCGASVNEVIEQLGPETPSTPPISAPTTAQPQASVAPVATAVPEPPPPPEAVPDKLGTASSSLAKRPAFGSSSSFAPQPPNVSAIYDEAGATSTTSSVGFVCLVSVKPYQDNAQDGYPDLSVNVTVSRGKEKWSLNARGAEDRVVMVFAVPLIELQAADRMTVSIIDRDIIFDDPIETLQTTFKGEFPFSAKGKRSDLTCRPIARDSVEKRLATPKEMADIAIAAYNNVKPDLMRSLGTGIIGDHLVPSAQSAITSMAGLVGWDDPRVVRRIEKIEAIRQRIMTQTSQQVQSLREKLPAPSQNAVGVADGAIEVKPSSYSCGPAIAKQYKALIGPAEGDVFAKNPCVLALDVRNGAGVPIQVEDFYDSIGPFGELRLISHTGGVHSLALFATTQNGKTTKLEMGNRPVFGPGESFTVLATPAGAESIAGAFDPPFMLRGRHDRRTTAKPKEWTTMAGGAVEMRATSIECGPKAAEEYNKNAPSFGRTSWEKPPACVVHASIRRTGSAPVTLGHFFREIKPLGRIGIFDPASYVPPKKGRVPGEDARGIWLKPFAVIRPDLIHPLDKDVEIAQGTSVDVALSSTEEPLPVAPDLDKLILAADFDDVYSFLRVE